MKRIFTAFFCLITLLFSVTSFAADNAEFIKLLSSVSSMSADFKQTIYDNKGKTIQVSSGQMMMQRPGKFRWNVIRPIPQLIIANGKKLWIYDADLQQVTIRSLEKATGETPALLLSNVGTGLEKDYNIKKTNLNTNQLQWYHLTSRQNNPMFSLIQMGFNANHQIKEMRLNDELGHSTIIQFGKIKTNIALADSFFIFKRGQNVDVINEKN